jgi:hypothetical protein
MFEAPRLSGGALRVKREARQSLYDSGNRPDAKLSGCSRNLEMQRAAIR